jgi:integrating conjugative element relaxase (TIGR03760 family)
MLEFFRRKKAQAQPVFADAELPRNLLRPESPTALLATPRRQRLIQHIWQRTSLSRAQFALLYLAPIERYAALVQQFPASEAHHHADLGGMLDHGLEAVAYALKLRQSYLLPVGAPPETQAAQSEAWTACAAYAALLHDVGKIAVDLHVEYADGERWLPWHGVLARPYQFRYRPDRLYRLHGAASGLLYTSILDRAVLDWLHGFPDLWASLLYVLAGQFEHAGILGELVLQADRASVAHERGGDPGKARLTAKHSPQAKLLAGLRYLVKQELKLNQPQASDGWLTEDALWLVSKTVSDKLRAHLLAQGIEGIPSTNVTLFNALQDHGIVQPTAEGKAIWRAKVTAEDGWTQSFTFLRVSPVLVWDADTRPASFRGTVHPEDGPAINGGESQHTTMTAQSNPAATALSSLSTQRPTNGACEEHADTDSIEGMLALFDASQTDTAPASAADLEPPEPQADLAVQMKAPSSESLHQESSSGMQFISWLQAGVRARRIIVNDAKALVHTVAGTAYLVSPGIFQRYVQEHPHVTRAARNDKMADWQWVQKHFEKLRVHKKQGNGLNIWMCDVTGPRKSHRLHGYLLSDGRTVFAEVPIDNPYLKLQTKDLPRSDAA